MTDFLTALALALAIEGVAYALFPGAMRRMMARMLALPAEQMRLAGLAAAGLGVLGVWMVRSALIAP